MTFVFTLPLAKHTFQSYDIIFDIKKNNSYMSRLESPYASLASTICPHNLDTSFVHIAYNSFHMVRSGFPLYGS